MRRLADDVKICGDRELDFQVGLQWLREKWNVKRLLCEGGGEVDDGLFRAGLVNELHLTVCPKIFGGRKAPTICDGHGFEGLAKAGRLRCKKVTRHGDELFMVWLCLPCS